jgi:hypothetical protein
VALAGGLPTGSSLGDPVLFLKRVIRQIAANDYERAWETLIPSQQRAVPRATYVRCESASPIPGTLASIEVKAVADSRVQVAGADSDPVAAKAVTLRLRIVDRTLHESVVITHTVHAVDAGGRWAWILPPNRLQADRASTCGAAPRP